MYKKLDSGLFQVQKPQKKLWERGKNCVYQWLYYDSAGAEKQTRPEDVGVIHTVK
jgi:hypothetical protein